ncbi:MAG: hypothetical protein IT353_01150 [Gemmatimonadaceae bacterium]|nr:hypothetical protein [Gemmatimonadaceae bacterium]
MRIDPTFRNAEDANAPQTYITGLAVSPHGRVFSLDFTSKTLQIREADGSIIRTVGRRGTGPGEFTSVGGIGLSKTGVWVTDPALSRIT